MGTQCLQLTRQLTRQFTFEIPDEYDLQDLYFLLFSVFFLIITELMMVLCFFLVFPEPSLYTSIFYGVHGSLNICLYMSNGSS